MNNDKVSKTNLATEYPNLATQWHPDKNGELTPYDIASKSNKKVWWFCEKNHEWESTVANRARGDSCPYCSGRYPSIENNLQIMNPELSKQWHPTKNGDLTPNDVTIKSKKRVWWICEKGHEWDVGVADRGRGEGCPYCAGKLVCDDNSLQALNPELAGQWHPSKNEGLTPNDVTAGSHKKAWWICEKEHEWDASIASRNQGVGCPYCAGRLACDDNSLQTLNPELAKQWHPDKNGELTPNNVTTGTGKKVWWICERGHEWNATISSRTRGNGCPVCYQGKQTSFPEQAIYFYFVNIFNDTLSRFKYGDKWEIDVFLPSLNFGIEYDGIFYHKKQKKINLDSQKEKYIFESGGSLLRVEEVERKLTTCYREDNLIFCNPTETQLDDVIRMCFDYISKNITNESYDMDINVKRDRAKIYDLYLETEERESLFVINPELSKQWHPVKNLGIKPYMLKPNSGKKVWWICKKGHEWEASISNRAKGRKCPFCAGKRVCDDNSLQTLNPELAKQWHPDKNGDLTPNEVTMGYSKKVWWQCEKGHEWDASVASRTTNSSNCPFCAGQRVCSDNSLQTLNSELAKQWHPTKNDSLTPNDVTAGSNKKVWWKCKEGHEWEATVKSRNHGRGCPFCSGRNKPK